MLQKILVTTLDNLFDLATIVVAAILVVRYQLTPPLQQDVPDIIVGILAVLGLMAVSGLWENGWSVLFRKPRRWCSNICQM